MDEIKEIKKRLDEIDDGTLKTVGESHRRLLKFLKKAIERL